MPVSNAPNDLLSYQDARWEKQFAKLVAFQQRFGHCRVPKRWREDLRLAIWVDNQRQAYWRNTLRADRQHRLVEIGFNGRGNPHARASWEDRFAQLAAFKARFGHCDVHCRWSEDPAFGHWVSTQRQFKKHGLLKLEQIRRLEELGFNWQLCFWKNSDPQLRRQRLLTAASQLEALNRRWEKRLSAWRNG
jgi:hypothetical protein